MNVKHSITISFNSESTVQSPLNSSSDKRLKISLTTNKVTISNCLPTAVENDSGIALINWYTSYAKRIENGVYNASSGESSKSVDELPTFRTPIWYVNQSSKWRMKPTIAVIKPNCLTFTSAGLPSRRPWRFTNASVTPVGNNSWLNKCVNLRKTIFWRKNSPI